MTTRTIINTLLILAALSLLPSTSQAHRILVFAYGDGPSIVGETSFSSGRKAKDVTITVMDEASKKVLATTKTNDKGEFKIAIPEEAAKKQLNLLIVANAGDGHRGEWHMAAEDYIEGAAEANDEAAPDVTTPAVTTKAPEERQAAGSTPVSQPQPAVQCLTAKEIERIVEKTMDRKLAPVKHMLALACEPGPSVTDILGGIGYIIGLGGIAAYFKSKKKEA